MMENSSSEIMYIVGLILVSGLPIVLLPFFWINFRSKKFLLPLAVVPALAACYFCPSNTIFEFPWFFMGGHMGIDSNGRVILAVISFCWMLSSLTLAFHEDKSSFSNSFYTFFLGAMAGSFGAVLAQGILDFYLFYALMSFSGFGLIYNSNSRGATKAGRVYLVMVILGEVAIFIALLIITSATQDLSLSSIQNKPLSTPALLFLFIGFGIKLGIPPFHNWMPQSYQYAPIPASVVFSSAMINVGVLGWMRFIPLMQIQDPNWAYLFIIAGSFAAIFGVLKGLAEKKPGAVLAYSSISQMGIITVLFGTGCNNSDIAPQLTTIIVVYLAHHSLAKCSLFLGYDVVLNRISRWNNLHKTALFLPSFALAGFPLTSGSMLKNAIKELSKTLSGPLADFFVIFLPITAVGTTILVLHFIGLFYSSEKTPKTQQSSANRYVWYISLTCVAFLFWVWPMTHSMAQTSLSFLHFFGALWPVTIGIVIFLSWVMYKRKAQTGSMEQHPKELTTAYKGNKEYQFSSFIRKLSAIGGSIHLQQLKWNELYHDIHHQIQYKLRKIEKISGRWSVTGFTFLLVTLLLLWFLVPQR